MIFPLAAPALVVVLNGGIVHSYNAPYIREGHVIAPIDPYVTRIAQSIGYSGRSMIVTRGDRFAQVRFGAQAMPSQLAQTYVEIAPLLRALGVSVSYDASRHVLAIQTAPGVLATATPFNSAVPLTPPQNVFTPAPAVTPRPLVTGIPAARRTPLPVPAPSGVPQ